MKKATTSRYPAGSSARLGALVAFALILLLLAVSAFGAPKNVILFIGDGMGFAHVAAARVASGGPGARLNMDQATHGGSVTTYSANSLVTDSAAAGTALATGTKTNNGMVSLSPDGARLKTILEAAREIGKATGIVTTTVIADATPAAFTSHVASRGQQLDIVGQMLASRANVLMGGGLALFIPQSQEGSVRKDDRDLLAEAAQKGYTVVRTADELEKANGARILGLFAMGGLTTTAPEPPLSTLAAKAIETLSKDRNGFFLMVEGGQIDYGGHGNDLDNVIKQTLEFDRAVGQGLEFARKNGDTLVVITADHETGGLCLLHGDGEKYAPSWASKGHTGTVVPLYSFGPGSERISGLMDNTEVSRTIADLLGVTIGAL